MRAKENLPKKENVRLVEDVTKDNMGLITRLRNCKDSPILSFVTSSTSLTFSFFGKFSLALIILYFTSELTNFTITGLASPIKCLIITSNTPGNLTSKS
jgi:hypothetical protein